MRVGNCAMFASVCLSKLERLKSILAGHRMNYEAEIKAEESHLGFLQNIKSSLQIQRSSKDLLTVSHLASHNRLSQVGRPTLSSQCKTLLETGSSQGQKFKKKSPIHILTTPDLDSNKHLDTSAGGRASMAEKYWQKTPIAHPGGLGRRTIKDMEGYSLRLSSGNIHARETSRDQTGQPIKKPGLELNLKAVNQRRNSQLHDGFVNVESVKKLDNLRGKRNLGSLTERLNSISQEGIKRPGSNEFNMISGSKEGSTGNTLARVFMPKKAKDSPKKLQIGHYQNEQGGTVKQPSTKISMDFPSPRDTIWGSLNESPIVQRRTVKQINDYRLLMPKPLNH